MSSYIQVIQTNHNCYRENITRDLYVYFEEVQALRKFVFWPQTFIDIERPSKTSEDHEFIWEVPLHMEKSIFSQWVKNYEVRADLQNVYIVHIQIHIPFHFRYQQPQFNQSFTEVYFPNPEVFIDCDHKNLKKFSAKSKGASKLIPQTDSANEPDFIPSALIPNGKKEDLP